MKQSPPERPNAVLIPEASPYVSNTTSLVCSANTNSILLQTARAMVYDSRNPDTCLAVRIPLDGGSKRSYIIERAKRMLKLEPEDERQLSIAAFGSA